MYYAATFHFFAGAVTGSFFKVRTLLILLVLVALESFALALTYGTVAWLWAVSNLVAIQFGYFAGMLGRGALEQAGLAVPNAPPRRLR